MASEEEVEEVAGTSDDEYWPEPLAMDAAAFFPDLPVCRRSLDEIRVGFKKYVISTFSTLIWIQNGMLADHLFCRPSSQLTTETRLSLICQIAQLPCLLVQCESLCDKTDCTTQSTNKAKILTVLLCSGLPVITPLLDGQKMKSRPISVEESILHYCLFSSLFSYNSGEIRYYLH